MSGASRRSIRSVPPAFGAHWTSFFTIYTHPDVRALALQDTGSTKYLWEGTDGTFDAQVYANLVRWSYFSGSSLSLPVAIPTAGVQGVHSWQTY
jgi:hypothetical protein